MHWARRPDPSDTFTPPPSPDLPLPPSVPSAKVQVLHQMLSKVKHLCDMLLPTCVFLTNNIGMVLKRVGNDKRRTKRVRNDILKTNGEPNGGRRCTENSYIQRQESVQRPSRACLLLWVHMCVSCYLCVRRFD